MNATEADILAEIRVAGLRVRHARDDYEQAVRYEQRMKDTYELMLREASGD